MVFGGRLIGCQSSCVGARSNVGLLDCSARVFGRGVHAWLCVLFVLLFDLGTAHAAPRDVVGRWLEVSSSPELAVTAHTDWSRFAEVSGPARTGGVYFYVGNLSVEHEDRYVIDFKSSSTIGRFEHWIFDAHGDEIARLAGGIESRELNPYFLRHAREVVLKPGRYRLASKVSSPFFLAQPDPFIDTVTSYRQEIKLGNAIVLLCLGIFIGLGLYYAALSFARRRVADAAYAFFILGNLLYNGTALLFLPDLFGMHWFYLVSVPILFSNCAYMLFVMALLEIRPETHLRLYRAGLLVLLVFVVFIVVATVRPNWSLELDRYGVGMFATFGLVAATIRAREGNSTARVYLVAIATFFVLGVLSISLSRLHAHTLYIEHVGLLAVVVEVVLLALVLAHQFALLHSEKDSAIVSARHSIRMASTDALTGLPNRYQLEVQLKALPAHGSLTFIDLDGLKHYNDQYGHLRGDQLLCGFANHLRRQLEDRATLYRLGGDEFAITSLSGDLAFVAASLEAAIHGLRLDGFEFAGASFGSVHVHESPTRDSLKHMADARMYEQKGRRKSLVPMI